MISDKEILELIVSIRIKYFIQNDFITPIQGIDIFNYEGIKHFNEVDLCRKKLKLKQLIQQKRTLKNLFYDRLPIYLMERFITSSQQNEIFSEERPFFGVVNISDFNLSTRLLNVLRFNGFKTIHDLVNRKEIEFSKLRNMGEASLRELQAFFAHHNIQLIDDKK